MKDELKIQLLKRKFQSLKYIEEFISNYQTFVQTGLDASDKYKQYRQTHTDFIPNDEMAFEEDFWESRVKPNFQRMLSSSQNTLLRLSNNEKGAIDYLDGLAGDFRGLSRGFDGTRETFMDIVNPDIRKTYLKLWNITDFQACNIEKTINNWWEDSSILDEEITGPIDENELLNYLEPGEKID
jgi:hypothetical protein